MVDSLGKSVPLGFLLAPSEQSDSITRQMNILKLTGTNCIDPSFINTRSIMTDEGSALVKVGSDMAGCHHCVCAFHINELDVRVSRFFFHFVIHFFIQNVCCHHLAVNIHFGICMFSHIGIVSSSK